MNKVGLVIKTIRERFIQNADTSVADWNYNYMKKQFVFCGISSPKRKELTKDLIEKPYSSEEVISIVLKLSESEFREEFYVAIDFFNYHQKNISNENLKSLYILIERNPWWDTIDMLQKPFSKYEDIIKDLVLYFNKQELFWYKRMAILLQLKKKEKMDLDLLVKVILDNKNNNEFFVQKAIAWVLREYSKTNKEWVEQFLQQYEWTPLVQREATKYL